MNRCVPRQKEKPVRRKGLVKLTNKVFYWARGYVQRFFKRLRLKRGAKRETGRALYEKIHALLSHAGIDLLSAWETGYVGEAEARRRLRALALRLLWLTLSRWTFKDSGDG